MFALFIWDRLPIATVSLGVLVALPLGFVLFPLQLDDGALDPLRFFAGFGNPALIAICALMIVGHALVITGALEPAARRLAKAVAASPRLALLGVLAMALSVSGVVNDTPVVVLLIPLLLAAGRQAKVAASGMLMPMNFAVLIGGMATTIGTSTNLIVVAIAASLGVGPIAMFSYFHLVAIAAVPALAYLWLVAPRLLAHVKTPADQLSEDAFDAVLHVQAGSKLDGGTLADAITASGDDLPIIKLMRGDVTLARLPTLTLRAQDRLVLRTTVSRLKELEGQLGLALHALDPITLRTESPGAALDPGRPGQATGAARANAAVLVAATATAAAADKAVAVRTEIDQTKTADADVQAGADADAAEDSEAKHEEVLPSAVVAQMVITPDSPLVGRSIRQMQVAHRYDIIVVGLRRVNQTSGWSHQRLVDQELHAGDVLLVQGQVDDMRDAQRQGLGLLLDDRLALPRQEKAGLAMAVMAGVVLLAATKTLPIALAALGGCVALLVGRCLSWRDVGQSMSTKVILLVAASLALGDALQATGATQWMGQGLAHLMAGLSPAWVAALLMAMMGLVTNLVSNNAAAAIGTPLAVSVAEALGAPPLAFVLAVLFGCNLCYLTPMGYQTNLLVMNAGGYRFSDFLKAGTPLFLIMWASLSMLLAWQFGL